MSKMTVYWMWHFLPAVWNLLAYLSVVNIVSEGVQVYGLIPYWESSIGRQTKKKYTWNKGKDLHYEPI